MNNLEIITHQEFDKISNIQYGFFTRNGGTSKGLYNSLNLKYDVEDDPTKVLQNIKIIAEHFKLTNHHLLIRPKQIHSDKTIVLTKPQDLEVFKTDEFEKFPKGDAIVTNLKNIVIGVVTADCIPVLFIDETNGVIGAVHAGWKGARYGILESVINAFLSLDAHKQNIKALLGPCIRQFSYEVDKNFLDIFLTENKKNRKFFTDSTKDKHYMFDNVGYTKAKLLKCGIKYIYDVNLDTYTDEKRFFSYRRNCIHGECKKYGAQFSGIMLK
jgi:polyphenol oxidase